MGSKLVLLLGLIVGGLLTFFCVNEDKREQLLNYKNTLLSRDVAETNQVDTINIALKERKREVEKEPNLELVSPPVESLIEKDVVNDKKITEELNGTQENQVDSRDEAIDSEPNILKETEEKIGTLLADSPIYFKKGSSTIRENSQKELTKIVTVLKRLPDGTVVTIKGYTDAIGKASFNKKLSQKRANSVNFYLKKSGLHNLTIKAIGYGEEQPLVGSSPNDKKNRRVEIELKRGE